MFGQVYVVSTDVLRWRKGSHGMLARGCSILQGRKKICNQ